MSLLDYRSDTVTKPTEAMRKAMHDAKVGDDVWGDDLTTIELETLAADFLGKESALFVPTGTMGNLLAILVHCKERGSEMIVGSKSHIHLYEGGGSAGLGGVHSCVLPNNDDGTIDLDKIENAIRKPDVHNPITRLICIENTHNKCGGKILSKEYMDDIASLSHKHNLKLHVDGARLCNAAIGLGLGLHPREVVEKADSVMMCLSKGLGAPIGSVLAGTKEFIAHARHLRKTLGGGMRQVGVLAACGLLSLTVMYDRLHEDNECAAALSLALSKVEHTTCTTPQSNIFFVNVDTSKVDYDLLVSTLNQDNLLLDPDSKGVFRIATHHQTPSNRIEETVERYEKALKASLLA